MEPGGQSSALARLEADTGTKWNVVTDVHGYVQYAKPAGDMKPIMRAGDNLQDAARQFLGKYPELFPTKADQLVIEDRGTDDEVDDRDLLLSAQLNGVPIVGSVLDLHVDSTGHISHIASTLSADPDGLNLSPKLTQEQVKAIVLNALNPSSAPGLISSAPTLVVLPAMEGSAEPAELAYRLDISGEVNGSPVGRAVLASAVDGATIRTWPLISEMEAVTGSGNDPLGNRKTFPALLDNGNYSLRRLSGTATVNGKTTTVCEIGTFMVPEVPIPAAGEPARRFVMSNSKDAWETDVTRGVGAAVDVYYNMIAIEAFFRTKLGWASWDGKGAPLVLTVHQLEPKDHTAEGIAIPPFNSMYNAYYSWATHEMSFGDGVVGDSGRYDNPLTEFEVASHEFTHAITGATSGLEYWYQSGALNEALSDIFATFSKYDRDPKMSDLQLFSIGRERNREPEGLGLLRDFITPNIHHVSGVDNSRAAFCPDNMKDIAYADAFSTYSRCSREGLPQDEKNACAVASGDSYGVHTNSSIVNQAFYLMTRGGTNPTSKLSVTKPLGFEASRKLWWALELRGLHAWADFAYAARSSIGLTKSLKISREPVVCAWVAVGVLSQTEASKVYNVECGGKDDAADSCDGKANGYYCSVESEVGYYPCTNDGIGDKTQCMSRTRCVGMSATMDGVDCVDSAGNATHTKDGVIEPSPAPGADAGSD